MLKKLFVTAAAAAAVSVPLAGVAWADPPSDPGSNGNGIGKGGIPNKTGNFLDTVHPAGLSAPWLPDWRPGYSRLGIQPGRKISEGSMPPGVSRS